MTMKDFVRKITSRKFWVALVGFVSSMLLAFGYAESETAQIAAIIMGGADVLGYLLAEGLTDASTAKATTVQPGILVGEIVSTETLNDTQKNE